jgi:hypothetical protein
LNNLKSSGRTTDEHSENLRLLQHDDLSDIKLVMDGNKIQDVPSLCSVALLLYFFNRFDRGCGRDTKIPIRQFDSPEILRDQPEILDIRTTGFVENELFFVRVREFCG